MSNTSKMIAKFEEIADKVLKKRDQFCQDTGQYPNGLLLDEREAILLRTYLLQAAGQHRHDYEGPFKDMEWYGMWVVPSTGEECVPFLYRAADRPTFTTPKPQTDDD